MATEKPLNERIPAGIPWHLPLGLQTGGCRGVNQGDGAAETGLLPGAGSVTWTAITKEMDM